MDLLLRNLLAHALQAACLTAGAMIIGRIFRALHPQLTLTFWQGVLVATAVLPFLQPWAPATARLSVSVVTTLAAADAAVNAAPIGGALAPMLTTVLAVGIIARLAWIALGLLRLGRFAARAERITEVPDTVAAAVHATGARPIFLQSDVSAPVSFGLFRGVVVLPREFSTLDSNAQYLAALHELLHVRRRDALQSLFEEVLAAILWFYPWTWWIRGRIRLAREQVVDRATAPGRTARKTYIRTLLTFSRGYPYPLPTASGMWRTRELGARIDALYREVTMSRSRVLVATLGAVGVLGSVAIISAAVFPLYSPSLPTAPRLAALNDTISVQQSADDEPIRIGGDVHPPKKIKDVKPVYPTEAKEAGIEGVVVIDAVINREGKVAKADVVKSVPELDQAALDAVLQWEFEPTYVKGKTVSVRMTITINFTLA